MPRTVESIVACHQAATALRAAGKPIWSRKIDIKAIIHEDQQNESPEHVSEVAQRIAALLRASIPKSFLDVAHDDYDCDLEETIEAMECCTVGELTIDASNGAEPVEMFNGWLEAIYDWADKNRVWLGN